MSGQISGIGVDNAGPYSSYGLRTCLPTFYLLGVRKAKIWDVRAMYYNKLCVFLFGFSKAILTEYHLIMIVFLGYTYKYSIVIMCSWCLCIKFMKILFFSTCSSINCYYVSYNT